MSSRSLFFVALLATLSMAVLAAPNPGPSQGPNNSCVYQCWETDTNNNRLDGRNDYGWKFDCKYKKQWGHHDKKWNNDNKDGCCTYDKHSGKLINDDDDGACQLQADTQGYYCSPQPYGDDQGGQYGGPDNNGPYGGPQGGQ